MKSYNIWNHTFQEKELQRDIEKAGFGKGKLYDDVSGTVYTGEKNTMCIVAYK